MNGGTGVYSYSWSTPNANTKSTLTEFDLESNVSAADSNGCSLKTAVTTVTVLQPPEIEYDVTITQPKCYGGSGLISGLARGGSGIFTYSWASTAGVPQIIAQPAPEAIFLDSLASTFYLEHAQVVCEGTGSHLQKSFYPSHSGYCSIKSTLSQYTPNLRIRGCSSCINSKYQAISFSMLVDGDAGLDNFFVSLVEGGTQSNTIIPLITLVTIEARTWTSITIDLSQFTDLTSPDGFILFNSQPTLVNDMDIYVDDVVSIPVAANGAGLSALPGFKTVIQALPGVVYFMSVIDGNGCPNSSTIQVTQPDRINMTYTSIPASTSGSNDGSIFTNVTGGVPPYSYQWVEVNSTSEDISNLSAGLYTLRVTDANGCSAELLAYVNPGSGIAVLKPFEATLSSGLAALVSVGLAISLFSAVMLAKYWPSFSTIGSFLSSMVLLGCILSLLSALVLLPEPTDALCTSFIWLLGIGFVLVYGCLFIKTWALYQVWRNAVHYQKASLTPMYIVKCLCAAVALEVAFLAVWSAIDPPRAHQIKVVNNQLEVQCNTDHITFWIIFLVVKGIWLLFGAVLSILTKNIAKEYNDSSKIAYAIYNNVLLGAIAIPLAVLLKEVPGGRLTVEVVIITIAFTFTMVVMFFKIWHSIFMPEKIQLSTVAMKAKRNTTSSTGSVRSTGEGTSRNSPTFSASASANPPARADSDVSVVCV